MAEGKGLTVRLNVPKQPVGIVYVTIAGPTAIPQTMPDDDPTVIVELVVLHMPPENPTGGYNGVQLPRQSVEYPVIAPGLGLTVTGVTTKQPVLVTV